MRPATNLPPMWNVLLARASAQRDMPRSRGQPRANDGVVDLNEARLAPSTIENKPKGKKTKKQSSRERY